MRPQQPKAARSKSILRASRGDAGKRRGHIQWRAVLIGADATDKADAELQAEIERELRERWMSLFKMLRLPALT
jgi:hypothetical protein